MFRKQANFRDVQKFHKKFGIPTADSFEWPSKSMWDFRYKFMMEELTETNEAFQNGNFEEFADGLIDLMYVTLGTMDIMGFLDCHIPRTPRSRLNTMGWYGSEEMYMKIMMTKVLGIDRAYVNKDYAKFFSYIQDLIEAIYSLAALTGLPWNKLWKAVHKANMKKVKATADFNDKRDHTFDIVKPKGWQKPDIAKILKKYYR